MQFSKVLALLALLAAPAHAQIAMTGAGAQLGALIPGTSLNLDFTTGTYYGCASLTACVSTTRASSKTNLLPSSPSGFAYTIYPANTLAVDSNGALIEESRVNRFLNSTVPATQTIVHNNPGNHILWVNGTGSITMSAGTGTGCGTGTATQGSSVAFNITSPGSCIYTVTGSLNAAQVELGSFGTSFIVTTITSVTRAADVPQLIGPAATASLAAKSAFFQTSGVAGLTGANRFLDNGARWIGSAAATDVRISMDGANFATAVIGGGGTTAGTVKSAFGWDSGSQTSKANNGTQGTNANGGVISGATYPGNGASGNRALNGYMQRFALSPTKGVFDGATAP